MNAESTPSISANQLFVITTGEYSDYTLQGVFKANTDLDILTTRDQYLTEYPEEAKKYSFEPSNFIAWLVRTNRAEQVDCHYEWHTGDYGSIDEEWTLDSRFNTLGENQ